MKPALYQAIYTVCGEIFARNCDKEAFDMRQAGFDDEAISSHMLERMEDYVLYMMEEEAV